MSESSNSELETDTMALAGQEPEKPPNGDISFGQFWREMPDKDLFLILAAGWIAVFYFFGNSTLGYFDTRSLFSYLWQAYNVEASEDSHGMLIPFVVAALLWIRRDELLKIPKRVWWPGLLGFALGLFIHLLGFAIQQTRVSALGFFLGLYFIMGTVWGPKWMRAIGFPYILVLFCIPIGSETERITVPLRILVTTLSVGFCNIVLGMDVVRQGSMIFDPQQTFRYDVAPACSGIRSLVSLFVLNCIFGAIRFKTPWKRLLIAGLALPLALIGNTVRIILVIIFGEAFGQETGQMIEQKLGFLTFLIALVAILLVGHWLREDKTPPSPTFSTPAP